MADPRALVRVWDTDGGVDSIPDDAHYFLGYDDGNPVIQEILARFPNAFIIPITTVPEANNLAARVADCETNAFTPSQAAYWAQQKINIHTRPCIYVEVSNKYLVEEALAYYGLEFERDVDCWLAWWGQPPVVPQGIVETPWGPVGTGVGNIAIQYLNQGNDFDMSVAYEDWVNPPPVPPKPKTHKGDDMEYFEAADGKFYVGTIGTDNKPHGCELVGNALVARQKAVAAGTREPFIPDVASGLYNFYVLGNTNP